MQYWLKDKETTLKSLLTTIQSTVYFMHLRSSSGDAFLLKDYCLETTKQIGSPQRF